MMRALSLAVSAMALVGSAHAFTPASSYAISVGTAVSDIAFDKSTGTLLALTRSSAGVGLGNSLVRYSDSGNVVSSVFVGSDPELIALGAGGQTAVVSMMGSPTYRTVDLNSFTPGASVDLGSNSGGAFYAHGLAASPTTPGLVVVSSHPACCTGSNTSVIYQDGVALSKQIPSYISSRSVVFSDDGQTLYGYDNWTSSFELYTMSVDAGGIASIQKTQNAFSGYYNTLKYDAGLLYASNGQVYDPAAKMLLGRYSTSTGGAIQAIAPDSVNGVVYGLSSNGWLTVFDMDTFVPIQTYTLDLYKQGLNVYGIDAVVTLNDGKLAMVVATGQSSSLVFLSPVPEPATVVLMSIGLAGLLFVKRRH